MRPIDADALRETMYHEAFEKDSDLQKWDSGCWIRYKLFEKCIDAAPTIEPKRGKWVLPKREGSISYDEHAYAECSVCSKKAYLGWWNNFCPNCGAKMDGSEE